MAVFWQYTLRMGDVTRTHNKQLQVRVTEEELQTFKKAAENDGRTLSNWARERLMKAAKKELK